MVVNVGVYYFFELIIFFVLFYFFVFVVYGNFFGGQLVVFGLFWELLFFEIVDGDVFGCVVGGVGDDVCYYLVGVVGFGVVGFKVRQKVGVGGQEGFEGVEGEVFVGGGGEGFELVVGVF